MNSDNWFRLKCKLLEKDWSYCDFEKLVNENEFGLCLVDHLEEVHGQVKNYHFYLDEGKSNEITPSTSSIG